MFFEMDIITFFATIKYYTYNTHIWPEIWVKFVKKNLFGYRKNIIEVNTFAYYDIMYRDISCQAPIQKYKFKKKKGVPTS